MALTLGVVNWGDEQYFSFVKFVARLVSLIRPLCMPSILCHTTANNSPQ